MNPKAKSTFMDKLFGVNKNKNKIVNQNQSLASIFTK